MVFEDTRHARPDCDRRARIAEQVADQPQVVGVRRLDPNDDIRALAFQRRMHRMPNALVAVNDAVGPGFFEAYVEAQATVADPSRPPLPTTARAATLQQQLLFGQRLPERSVEA